MRASKVTAERQGLLFTRSAKALGILTFDFAEGETGGAEWVSEADPAS